MKQLLIFFGFTLLVNHANSAEISFSIPTDSIERKKWTKEDFVKEFGFNDSARALINLFFTKNKRGKTQTIVGGALLFGGIAALASPFEQNDDQNGFGDLVRPVAEPGAAAVGAIITTSGIIKLGRYTKEKLFILLSGYKSGSPIPQEYRKRMKWKYFYPKF